jgi:uncharacterized iron-regulated membrane protein
MSWLHTWCSLTCGWLLCVIFLAGSLSVFREPITRWMQAAPALHSAVSPAGVTDTVLVTALAYLGQHATNANVWNLVLPDAPGDALMLSWRSKGAPMMQVAVDPIDGRLLPQPWGRATEGGRHFMAFHYMLHAGMAGFWLVGWIAMCALVAVVSGVIVHKRIFKDFFTFRPGRGQRSWLDAHNVTAVLTLPFLVMIIYTGLTYFYSSYMPWPLQFSYGSGAGAYQTFQSELKGETDNKPVAGMPLVLPQIAQLRQQAATLTGEQVRRIFIMRPGKSDMVVRMSGGKPDRAQTRTIHSESGLLIFEQAGARITEVVKSGAPERFSSQHVHSVLEQLHIAGFGGWSMRWLYFVSGMAGTVMIATGLLLFSVKRRQKSLREFGDATPQVYRMIDILNVTAIVGAGVASIGYLYANRLLPADMPNRADAEIQAYFGIWLACLLHAIVRPPAAAWREQTTVLAMLCLGLPLLNWLTTGQHLLAYLAWHDWQRAGVELTVLGMGGLLLLVRRKLAPTSSSTLPARK